MTQATIIHPRGGWQENEIELLFNAVKEATREGLPLRDVFESVGARLARRPNSIRNFYYAKVRETPELAARQTPFQAFTEEELKELLRNVLIGRGQGESVRACVTRLADGGRAGMLRYQNKYRSILKNKPELLLSVAEELRAEGKPCPETVIACRRYDRAPRVVLEDGLAELNRHMDDPCVARMVEGLCELLRRPEPRDAGPSGDVVPYHKWADTRREADRLRVEVDLLKIALEDAQAAFDAAEDD